jgi:selenocysteine lyase/cysteine desulfurase
VTGGIFLDSAGSSLPPDVVLDTVIGHIRREAEVGGYLAQAERADDLAAVKTAIATLIGATPDAIALGDSASRAWSDFFYSVPLGAGDRILVSEVDYSSNSIATLHRARVTGARVEVMPSDPAGGIDLAALENMLDERVRLVSVVHVPTNGGLVNPAAEVARLAHRVGALVLLDACQSAGQLPLDVAELGCDALSATGRKWLRGPRGTGFLYVRPDLIGSLEPIALDNRGAEWTEPGSYQLASDATRFEFWEHNVAARLGLGAAVRYLLDAGPAEVYAGIAARAAHLRAALAAIPGVTIRDQGTVRGGIVSFTVDGVSPADVRERLLAHGVTVTVSLPRSTLLDMTARNLFDGVVRASPHTFVGFQALDRAAAAVAGIAGQPRQAE